MPSHTKPKNLRKGLTNFGYKLDMKVPKQRIFKNLEIKISLDYTTSSSV
jgi:hypothetical protein